MKYIGQRIPAVNNRILVRGKGKYVADLDLPGAAHLTLCRSTHAHARIRAIDVGRARAMPGVLDVLTGADLRKVMKATPLAADPREMGGNALETWPLAGDVVRYVGEPVVAVLADDRYTAYAALATIDVDYDPLPVVMDAVKALEPGSPLLVESWGNNVLLEKRFTRGDVARALERADGVVRGTVKAHRYGPVPIETRAYAASWDPASEDLTVWASTQMPHSLRQYVADVLEMPDTHVRVIQPHVGGTFGLKVPPFPEEILVAWLSRKFERPVRWVEERGEHLTAVGHCREETLTFTAGYANDGKVVALDVRVVADIGAPQGAGWPMAFVSAFCIPTVYEIDDCTVQLYAVVTNKAPWTPYRAFGKEAATFLMERIMDKVARATGCDRAEVRRRNFVPVEAFPFRQVSGAVLDSGNYPAVWDRLLEAVEYESFGRRQQEARKQGRYLGLGIAFELTPEGAGVPKSRLIQGYDGTSVRMSPEGRVTVLTGVTSPGSGNETGIAQIVADHLGVPLADVRVIQGDTQSCPYGLGNGSSRSVMMGGGAAYLAARQLREKLLTVGGRMLEVSPQDLDIEDGVVHVRGAPQRRVAVGDVAKEIYRHTYGPAAEGVEPGLEATRYSRIGNLHHQPERHDGHFSMYPTWPYGAMALEVEVDRETGVVKILRSVFIHDCGTVINPLLVEANVHGSLGQALGAALYERYVYDDAGQLQTASLMDYTLPTAVDLPRFELGHFTTPSPFTDLGTKGAGESAMGAPLAAVVSAVENALAEFGVVIDETPVTPDRVWRAIRQAGAS